MASALEQACRERGIRLSAQRRVILQALETAHDHPCAYDVHQCVALRHKKISVATVYRALNGFTQAGLLVRRDFGDGKARYERARAQRHDHLVDVHCGHIVEFDDVDLGLLIRQVAARLGYRLVDYRLELFGEPIIGHRGPEIRRPI